MTDPDRRKIRARAAPITRDAETMSRAVERQGPGEALPTHLRAPAEQSLGLPLDDVRLHRDSNAGAFTRFANARAAQWRNHIFVRPDLYAPDQGGGRDLLGHELVHAGQYAAFGAGAAPVSGGHEASEAEARTLAPKVLGGEPGAAAPRAAPAANLNRDAAPGTEQVSKAAPQVCDPNNYQPEDSDKTATADRNGDEPRQTDAQPDATGGVTQDPATIDVRSMSNADLIAEAIEIDEQIASFKVSSPESAAWEKLKAEAADERRRRIQMGFVFLAEQKARSPALLVQLTGGAKPGVTSVIIADSGVALGTPDVTLTGPIMSSEQFQAYLRSAGIQPVSGPRAAAMMQAIKSGPFGVPTGGPEMGLSPFGPGRSPGYNPAATGFSFFRNSPRDNMLAYGGDRWQMPIDTKGDRAKGQIGEAAFWLSPDTVFGRQAQDLNSQKWKDVRNTEHEGNAPIADIKLIDPTGKQPGQPVSVAVGDTAYLMKKFAMILDVPGRNAAKVPSGPPTDAAVQSHLRAMTGDPKLTPGTPAYDAARQRFLADTVFAVPQAELAKIRGAVQKPNEAAPDSHSPITMKYRDLYDAILRAQPIPATLNNGKPVKIDSMDALVERMPNAERVKSEKIPGGPPSTEILSPKERQRVFDQLGATAASRIIARENATGFLASADLVRGVGTKKGVEPTRALDIDSADFAYGGERISEALQKPDSVRWRDAKTSESDPYLSFMRMETKQPNLTRDDPNFAALRTEVIRRTLLAIPEAQRGPLLEAIANSKSQTATDIRAVLAAEHPHKAPAEQAANMLATFDVSTAEATGARDYAKAMADQHGDNAPSHLNADAIAAARARSGASTALHYGGSAARGAGGALVSVATTRGLDWVTDTPSAPYGGWDLARDTALSIGQEELERQASRRIVAQLAIRNAALRNFAGRAGPGFIVQPLISMGMEAYSISEEDYDHDTGQVAARMAHAGGTGLAAAGAGVAAAYFVGDLAATGAAIGVAGGPLGILAGAAVGALVGFIIVGVAAATAAYAADRLLPGSGESYRKEHEQEVEDRRRREAEERRRQPLMNFSPDAIPTSMFQSPDLTPEEQALIEQWFLAEAGKGPAPNAQPGLQ
jgi:hypothetical protein